MRPSREREAPRAAPPRECRRARRRPVARRIPRRHRWRPSSASPSRPRRRRTAIRSAGCTGRREEEPARKEGVGRGQPRLPSSRGRRRTRLRTRDGTSVNGDNDQDHEQQNDDDRRRRDHDVEAPPASSLFTWRAWAAICAKIIPLQGRDRRGRLFERDARLCRPRRGLRRAAAVSRSRRGPPDRAPRAAGPPCRARSFRSHGSARWPWGP